MLSPIELHYAKHKEDLRLQRRHGIVEYTVTMAVLHRFIGSRTCCRILDVGCGTGRYAIALREEGHDVECVELVQHNIDVMLSREPSMRVCQGDARHMPWIADASQDIVLLLGPLYHLIGDEAKTAALSEARRVLRPDGVMLVAYLMNEYSILQYCFDQDRIGGLMERGFVDGTFHVRTPEGELYDYVRLEDIDRLNAAAGLRRLTIFSPEGPADYMRTRINYMADDTFRRFIDYQLAVCERPDLLGAGSHVVDVVQAAPRTAPGGK